MIPCTVPRQNFISFSSLPILDKSSCCKKPKKFSNFAFRDPRLFYKFNICKCRFFLCCCSPFCNANFNCVFLRFRILGFVPKLVLLMNSLNASKVACGNRSGLSCKFCIPSGVVAVLNSNLYPRRHILIRSYNEKKLQQGVKKTSFLFFHTSLLQVQNKYCFLFLNTSLFSSLAPDYCIPSDYSAKEELMNIIGILSRILLETGIGAKRLLVEL